MSCNKSSILSMFACSEQMLVWKLRKMAEERESSSESEDDTHYYTHLKRTKTVTRKRKLVNTPVNSPTPDEIDVSPTVTVSREKRVRRRRQAPSAATDNGEEDTILFLRDALDDAHNEAPDDEELDIVVLPPPNSMHGDTDVEDGGDEECINAKQLCDVREVTGTLEIHSSRGTSRCVKDKIYKELPPNYKDIVKQESANIERIADMDIDCTEKITRLIEHSTILDNVRKWEKEQEGDTCKNRGLLWETKMNEENSNNLENLIASCQGKLPVEIFEMLFDSNLQDHIVTETVRYAHQKNSAEFKLTTNHLKTFIGILFYSGYHSLPQQKLYWERNSDVLTPLVHESMSRNRFLEIKRNLHFADNQAIDLTDKFAKVRPLYDITNQNINKFGHWHLNYSIDEQMIPYFGMHSAKQTNRAKSVRFGYKNFVLTSSDGYPYQLIPYCGAKGIHGVPGKDLTLRVVLDLVLQHRDGIGNLAFDNWYTSARLMSILASMKVPTIGTVRSDRIGKAPLMSTSQIGKQKRGQHSYVYDPNQGIHCANWMDNAAVTMLSTSTGVYPLKHVERWSKSEKKKILVPQPAMIKSYNETMGGVDLLDSAVATYRPVIRGKKWYWPHFINTIGVLMGAAWRIYRATTVETDLSLLFFVRSVVQSYLHRDIIISGPQYVQGRSTLPESVRYTGKHYPKRVEKQRRCKYNSCNTKVRFICERCDVGLCIQNDHFKLYHEK